jgi:hypothetical protein
MIESPTYIQDDLNITLGRWTILTNFPVAEGYILRFIYANNYWETRGFQITTSEQSRNASDTSSSTSPVLLSTSYRSTTMLWITESTGTGTSSLAREFIHSTIVTSPLVPETTLASGPGAAATAATTHVSTSNENNDDGLSPGAKVGIGIGCAAAAIIGLVGLLLLYRIRKKGKSHPSEAPNLPSVDSTKLYGSSDTRKVFEADGKYEAANMPELPSDHFTRSELPG